MSSKCQWCQSILDQLQLRKSREQTPYEDICSLASKLSDRIYTLEGDNARLSSELLSVQRIVLAEGTEPARELISRLSDLSVAKPASALEKKVSDLQKNLSNALKEKGDCDQTIIELKSRLDEKDVRIGQLTLSLEEKSKEVSELRKALDNLKDENIALSLSYKSLEKQNQKLRIEHDSLCQHILVVKRDNAERLNAQNEMEMQERLRREVEANVTQLNKIQFAKIAAGDPTSLAHIGALPDNFDHLVSEESLRGLNAPSRVPSEVKICFDAHEVETCAINWYCCSGPRDDYLATGGGCDRNVKIWKISVDEYNLVATLHGSNASINSIDVEADALLASSNDMAARVWSVNDHRLKVTLTGHSAKVVSAKFIGTPNRAASCSTDRTVKIWDTNQPACIRTYFAGSCCYDLVYYHNLVITGHLDGIVRCWDLKRHNYYEPAGEIKLQSKITSLDVSKDGTRLICSLRDNTIKSVDLRKMEVLQTYFDEKFRVSSDTCRARFSVDGRYIACGSADGSLYIWDASSTRLVKALLGSNNAVLACYWSPDGTRIASIERGKKVSIWA